MKLNDTPHRPELRRDQAAAAGHLGQRRLRRRRHHAADRRRVAGRGRRRARRRARARRRRRQRQRDARRRAPLRRRRPRPTTCRRCSTRAARAPRAEGLSVRFQEADVEELPFADASFDVVLSTFGAMFAPDHARTAREMLRVLRPGGRIGLANWTPEGFIGRLFKVIGAHVPPPAGLTVARAVGQRAAPGRAVRRRAARDPRRAPHLQLPLPLRRRTGSRCSATTTARRTRRSPRSTPPASARSSATSPRCSSELNVAGPDSLVVPTEYLEIVVTKG